MTQTPDTTSQELEEIQREVTLNTRAIFIKQFRFVFLGLFLVAVGGGYYLYHQNKQEMKWQMAVGDRFYEVYRIMMRETEITEMEVDKAIALLTEVSPASVEILEEAKEKEEENAVKGEESLKYDFSQERKIQDVFAQKVLNPKEQAELKKRDVLARHAKAVSTLDHLIIDTQLPSYYNLARLRNGTLLIQAGLMQKDIEDLKTRVQEEKKIADKALEIPKDQEKAKNTTEDEEEDLYAYLEEDEEVRKKREAEEAALKEEEEAKRREEKAKKVVKVSKEAQKTAAQMKTSEDTIDEGLDVLLMVYNDETNPVEMRDMALLMYVYNYIALDRGGSKIIDVTQERLIYLSRSDGPFRLSALELKVVQAMKRDDTKTAREILRLILKDPEVSETMQNRLLAVYNDMVTYAHLIK